MANGDLLAGKVVEFITGTLLGKMTSKIAEVITGYKVERSLLLFRIFHLALLTFLRLIPMRWKKGVGDSRIRLRLSIHKLSHKLYIKTEWFLYR